MHRSTTRLSVGLLALVLGLGLAACGGSPTASDQSSKKGSDGVAEALYA